MDKKQSRLKRAARTRYRIRRDRAVRLTVHRSSRHIYAQIIDADGRAVLASASTLDRELNKELRYPGNVEAAAEVGRLIAERGKAAGVTRVAFDRSGFKYHGRMRALADAARENGLEF